MKLNPYLAFDGRCREAFEFYQNTFGGQISFIQTIGESPMASSMPPEAQGRIMHVTLHIGDQVLQGADAPPGQFTKPDRDRSLWPDEHAFSSSPHTYLVHAWRHEYRRTDLRPDARAAV